MFLQKSWDHGAGQNPHISCSKLKPFDPQICAGTLHRSTLPVPLGCRKPKDLQDTFGVNQPTIRSSDLPRAALRRRRSGADRATQRCSAPGLGLATFTKNEGGIVICDLQGINPIVFLGAVPCPPLVEKIPSVPVGASITPCNTPATPGAPLGGPIASSELLTSRLCGKLQEP